MGSQHHDPPEKCPECLGAGEVLLLFSRAKCPDCGGTGEVVDEEGDTGEFPMVTDLTVDQASSGEGSGGTISCDPEDDPSYFDDGLEFDDDEGAGGDDEDLWEPDD